MRHNEGSPPAAAGCTWRQGSTHRRACGAALLVPLLHVWVCQLTLPSSAANVCPEQSVGHIACDGDSSNSWRQHHSAAVCESCTALLQGMARLRGRRGSGDSSMRSTRRQGARQAAGCSTHHPLGSWRNAHCEGRPAQSPGPAQVQQRQHRLALHATTPACRLTWTGLAVISCATELREQQQGWEGSICRPWLGSRGALVGWRECCAALPPRSRPAHLLRRGKVSCRPSTGLRLHTGWVAHTAVKAHLAGACSSAHGG